MQKKLVVSVLKNYFAKILKINNYDVIGTLELAS